MEEESKQHVPCQDGSTVGPLFKLRDKPVQNCDKKQQHTQIRVRGGHALQHEGHRIYTAYRSSYFAHVRHNKRLHMVYPTLTVPSSQLLININFQSMSAQSFSSFSDLRNLFLCSNLVLATLYCLYCTLIYVQKNGAFIIHFIHQHSKYSNSFPFKTETGRGVVYWGCLFRVDRFKS